MKGVDETNSQAAVAYPKYLLEPIFFTLEKIVYSLQTYDIPCIHLSSYMPSSHIQDHKNFVGSSWV